MRPTWQTGKDLVETFAFPRRVDRRLFTLSLPRESHLLYDYRCTYWYININTKLVCRRACVVLLCVRGMRYDACMSRDLLELYYMRLL